MPELNGACVMSGFVLCTEQILFFFFFFSAGFVICVYLHKRDPVAVVPLTRYSGVASSEGIILQKKNRIKAIGSKWAEMFVFRSC